MSLHVAAHAPSIHDSIPPSYFPCLDSRPGMQGAWQSTEVSFRDVNWLRAFCQDKHVSSLSVFQAAWALVLQCYLGNPKLCFACESSVLAEDAGENLGADDFVGICQADIGERTSALDIMKGPCLQKTQCSIGERGTDSRAFPINTSLVLRKVRQQAWTGMDGIATRDHTSIGLDNVRIVKVQSCCVCEVQFY